jgi:predicted glycoside hydrolase/deacetylase ChbG (UPF0249 family)
VKIIINCDDLGMNHAVNEAIFDLMKEGRVTSATIMTNGAAVEEAAARTREFPNWSFGVHLNATEFAPLTNGTGLRPLLNAEGQFAKNIRSVPLTSAVRHALFAEWSAQVERALALGVRVSHLDSHHHVHTLPRVFGVLKRVQRRFGIRKVRLTRNFFGLTEDISARLRTQKAAWNFALRHYVPTVTTRGLTSFVNFHEWIEHGRVGQDRLKAGRCWTGSIELMTHPGGESCEAETALLWSDWKEKLAPDAQLIGYNDLQ